MEALNVCSANWQTIKDNVNLIVSLAHFLDLIGDLYNIIQYILICLSDSHNNNKTSVDNCETKLPLPLQPESQLVPFQRLWQDIVRSVTKWSPAASTIALTHTHLNHLTHIPQDQFHSPGKKTGRFILNLYLYRSPVY